ncbi:MAG: SH3 domain-containing protein [Anaerolineaceae bacterium]|nr:SH3 domain-containing protein [Anaerolineaceae bacterium]
MLQIRKSYWLNIIFITILLAGCNVPSAEQAPAAPTQEVAPAETATPALVMYTATVMEETQQPEVAEVATITPTASIAPQTDSILEGETTVTSINMRSGPTTIHDVVGTYNIGTLVTILGQTPDGDWLYVQPRDNNFGWMYADFVNPYIEPDVIPVMVPTGSTIFHGKVTNTADNSGVSRVGIAIVQGSGEEVLRSEVYTMANGEFDAYLPNTAIGLWRVVVVGVQCESNIMIDNCTYTGTFSPDLGYSFTIPDIPAMEFSYTP